MTSSEHKEAQSVLEGEERPDRRGSQTDSISWEMLPHLSSL